MAIISKIAKVTKAAAAAEKKAKKAKKLAAAAEKKADKAAAKVAAAKKKKDAAKKKTTASKKKSKEGKATLQAPVRMDRSRGESINEEVAGTREVSGFTGRAEKDIEQGKAGEVTSGDKSVSSFYDLERGNPGRRKRNELVASLETKQTKGTITKAEKTELDGLNAASARNKDKAVTSAAISNAANASKKKGVSLAGEDGKTLKVGQTVKQPSGQMIGDTKNGINRVTGEIFGTPTPNQFKMAMRDLEARTNLSATVKRDRMAKLVKAAGRTKEQRQDATIANMERRMVDTGTDKSGRAFKKGGTPKKKKPTYGYSYGGMTTSKPRKGNTDYRMGGMFTKKGKK